MIWLVVINHKDLAKKTQWDKGLRNKAYEIASNTGYEGYQRGLKKLIRNLILMGLLKKQITMLKSVK